MAHPLRGQYWFFLFVFLSKSFFLISNEPTPTVIVSVAPHKFFVEKIAKETLQVNLMVPAGASSHTYEPSPRQMLSAGKADIWFRIGETFENRAINALTSHHPEMEIVNLQQGLDLIQSHEGCCCPGSVDLHFWLSARLAQIQAKTIANALIQTYPNQADYYRANLQTFLKELQELDQKIKTILASLKKREILVSHPAYAYFCRDYNLEQYAIEVEGKDPAPQQMTKLLNLVRQLEIKTIFIQIQYNNKAAKLVAEAIGAKLVVLDPYSEQFFASMLEIAHAFANE